MEDDLQPWKMTIPKKNHLDTFKLTVTVTQLKYFGFPTVDGQLTLVIFLFFFECLPFLFLACAAFVIISWRYE